jgi:hypothetical protein
MMVARSIVSVVRYRLRAAHRRADCSEVLKTPVRSARAHDPLGSISAKAARGVQIYWTMRSTPQPVTAPMNQMIDAGSVIALVRDLIFASRITATAGDVGTAVTLVRDPAKLSEHQMNSPDALLIVDLNLAGAIDAARGWKAATGGTVAGFVSHVDTATITAARDAGVDRVLARSRFVELLPALLRRDLCADD